MLANLTKEFRYNWKLSAPVIMSLLGHTFVGFADNIMVGQLGSADLAAVSLGNSFFFVAMSLGIGFSTAITPLVAEADSENNFFIKPIHLLNIKNHHKCPCCNTIKTLKFIKKFIFSWMYI